MLTAKRWEVLKPLCAAGPVSIPESARRVGRDMKAVHSDVTALVSAGVLGRAEVGALSFPSMRSRSSFCSKPSGGRVGSAAGRTSLLGGGVPGRGSKLQTQVR